MSGDIREYGARRIDLHFWGEQCEGRHWSGGPKFQPVPCEKVVLASDHTAALADQLQAHQCAEQMLKDEIEGLRKDAENWRALMACRMRTIGSAKVNAPDDPWTYLVLEFWTGHPDPTDQPWLAELFEKFMAKARKAALSPKEPK